MDEFGYKKSRFRGDVPIIGGKAKEENPPVNLKLEFDQRSKQARILINPAVNSVTLDAKTALQLGTDLRNQAIQLLAPEHPHIKLWGKWVMTQIQGIWPDPIALQQAGERNFVFDKIDDAIDCGRNRSMKENLKSGQRIFTDFYVGKLDCPVFPNMPENGIVEALDNHFRALDHTGSFEEMHEDKELVERQMPFALTASVLQVLLLVNKWPPKWSIVTDIQCVPVYPSEEQDGNSETVDAPAAGD